MSEGHNISGSSCSICGYQQSIIALVDVPVGSYIEYYPTADSATISNAYTGANSGSGNQTLAITKTGTNKIQWKVYANNSGQLDIISAESVGNLTLYGVTGYANGLYALNMLCSQYANEYADIAVSMGSTKEWITGPVTKADVASLDKTKTIGMLDTSSSGYPITYDATKKLSTNAAQYPYTSDEFTNDTIPCEDTYLLSVLRHNGNVWRADRKVHVNDGYSLFAIGYLDTTGRNTYSTTLYIDDASDIEKSVSNGVRPVISLKSGLKIVDGEGTSASPYVVSF